VLLWLANQALVLRAIRRQLHDDPPVGVMLKGVRRAVQQLGEETEGS
jgi:hypothetical protein